VLHVLRLKAVCLCFCVSVHVPSLSRSRSGDGSPPWSSPGSSIGVLGRFDSGDLLTVVSILSLSSASRASRIEAEGSMSMLLCVCPRAPNINTVSCKVLPMDFPEHLLIKYIHWQWLRRPCSDFMDMLRRPTNCRIIIIIIIIYYYY